MSGLVAGAREDRSAGARRSTPGSTGSSRRSGRPAGGSTTACVDEAGRVVDRAGARLRLSAEHTVVALAGATGSGKSSTFNALAGLDLAAVGVRRPTTSYATACVWGDEGAAELLEWLDIPPRHRVVRDSMLDRGHQDNGLDGLVLLDLPDHDSTEVSHHLEVERLVGLTDLMVWVLDPQKYADAAVHQRFLAPLATHRDVMLVVLNHIDEVSPDGRGDDARRRAPARWRPTAWTTCPCSPRRPGRRGDRRAAPGDRQAGRRQGRHRAPGSPATSPMPRRA